MSELASQQCEACRADAPKVSDEELRELMQLIPDWQPLVEEGGAATAAGIYVSQLQGGAGLYQPPGRAGGGGVPPSGHSDRVG